MRITPKELACLFIFSVCACLAEEKNLSSGTNDNLRIATRIAHKQYGTNCTLKSASPRKAILASFQRLGGMGDKKYLLIKMPDVYNQRGLRMQELGGNGAGRFYCPKEEVDPLFQEESWKQLRKYGKLFSADVFATPASTNDFPQKLVGTVAKYTLRDQTGNRKDQEWTSVYFKLEPMNIEQYEFHTNRQGGIGMNILTCSIFMDTTGILIHSMPDEIIFAD